MNTIKRMVLTAGVIGVCLMCGQAFAAGYGYGLGTRDCLSAFQNNTIDMQAARGNADPGGHGPGDGTGNGGKGPQDGKGNGPGDGTGNGGKGPQDGNGPGTGDCLGALQLDVDHLQAARSGKGGNSSGRNGSGNGTGKGGNGSKGGSGNGGNGPRDGSGNGGNGGPKDGSGNGNQTGDCTNAS